MFESTRKVHVLADRVTQSLLVTGIVAIVFGSLVLGIHAAYLPASAQHAVPVNVTGKFVAKNAP